MNDQSICNPYEYDYNPRKHIVLTEIPIYSLNMDITKDNINNQRQKKYYN